MSQLSDFWAVTTKLATPDLLRYLLTERFPGKTVVTSSLRARSVVVLSMIAEIDPATPVVFCRPGHLFPDSLKYRERILDQLGLVNFTETEGHEASPGSGESAYSERMWSEYKDAPGRTFEIVHLDKTLAPYDCWISAVYHDDLSGHVQHRVDRRGRLIRINPLLSWTQDDVRQYMAERKLPFHPRSRRRKAYKSWPAGVPTPSTYHF